MTDLEHPFPLTPAVFHILLALARGEKHGYEIMKTVRQDSNGMVAMGNGTLYGSLKRMLADGLIEDAGSRADDDDTRRKYYRLTDLGQKAMNAEIERYSAALEVARKHQLTPALSPKANAMKYVQRLYQMLLSCYPRDYRETFGPEMRQTFLDHYQDRKETEDRVSLGFWISAITDELKNIACQHAGALGEGNRSPDVSFPRLMVALVFFLPLYLVCYALLVRVALTIPHPPLRGIGVLLAFGGLCLFSFIPSGLVSCALSNRLVAAVRRAASSGARP